MRIAEDWVEKESEQGQRKLVKRWQVNFCVGLPEAGNFYARINHIDCVTDVNLWVEDAITFAKAQKKLEQLRVGLQQRGVQVGEIVCANGVPQMPDNRIHYALVDVNT